MSTNNSRYYTHILQECDNCKYRRYSRVKGLPIYCTVQRIHTRYNVRCTKFEPTIMALYGSLHRVPDPTQPDPQDPDQPLMITLTPSTMSAIQDFANWLNQQILKEEEEQ